LVTVTADTSQYDVLKQLLLKYNAAGVDVNMAQAGEQITQVRGSDPAAPTQPGGARVF